MVEQPSAEQLRADAADAAQQTRAVLAAIIDPADELTASAATRHRLEGAVLALDAVAAGSASVERVSVALGGGSRLRNTSGDPLDLNESAATRPSEAADTRRL